jgi:surfeit locus 1 family protein
MEFLRLFFSRRWWWTTLIIIAGVALTIRLGIWQLDRHATRQATIRQVQAMQAMPALDLTLAPLPANLDEMEYRQVIATGVFDFEHQVVLRNQARQRMSGTDPGYGLITPLLLENGQAVMVERGWIPIDHNSPESWRDYDEAGVARVEGVIRRSMAAGEIGKALVDPTLAPGQTQLQYWNFVNLPRLQEQLPYPIINIYIQEAQGEAREAIPSSLLEQPDLDPGTHMGFALQWFFYAGLLFFGYPVWLRKQGMKTLPTPKEG